MIVLSKMAFENLVFDRFGNIRKMLKTFGSKQGDKFVRSETQMNMFRQWWKSLKDGTMLTAEYKVFRPPKSYQQVKTHFGLLINTVIAKTNDEGIDTSKFLKLLVRDDLPTGVGLTSDFLHQLFYLVCPTYTKEGKRVTLSSMTTEEASDWFERCRNLLASRGICVDDPDPNWNQPQGNIRKDKP